MLAGLSLPQPANAWARSSTLDVLMFPPFRWLVLQGRSGEGRAAARSLAPAAPSGRTRRSTRAAPAASRPRADGRRSCAQLPAPAREPASRGIRAPRFLSAAGQRRARERCDRDECAHAPQQPVSEPDEQRSLQHPVTPPQVIPADRTPTERVGRESQASPPLICLIAAINSNQGDLSDGRARALGWRRSGAAGTARRVSTAHHLRDRREGTDR